MAEDRWTDDKIDQLRERVDDQAEQLGALEELGTAVSTLLETYREDQETAREDRTINRDFRAEVRGAVNALTRERPDGSREVAPGRLDFKTWILVVSTIVVPIVIAILSQS